MCILFNALAKLRLIENLLYILFSHCSIFFSVLLSVYSIEMYEEYFLFKAFRSLWSALWSPWPCTVR